MFYNLFDYDQLTSGFAETSWGKRWKIGARTKRRVFETHEPGNKLASWI